jgi:isopenicillin-N N-acyltransferase-like protein
VRRLLEDRWGEIDRQAAREILCDHANAPSSICRHLDEGIEPEGRRVHSVFSLVMNLEERTLELTDGPPCCGQYLDPVRATVLAELPA